MEFEAILSNRVSEVNAAIKGCMPKSCLSQSLLLEAMNYSIDVGGKRIRPLFIKETYRLFGGKEDTILAPFMAAMECIHTYSLVHDDLPAMDNDDYRRGQLTTHKKYGEDFGILAGDGLLNYAYEIMLDACNKAVDCNQMKYMLRAASILAKKAGVYGMVGGQSLDVYLTGKTMNSDDLDYIFENKTAALIEASFMMGAVLAGADDKAVECMEKAGSLIGIAFQIQDDILDVIGDEAVLGKPVLSDEKNNKTTYVSLYGMDKAKADVKDMSDEAVFIIKRYGNNEFLEELIKHLINRNN